MTLERLYFCSIVFLFGNVAILISTLSILGKINSTFFFLKNLDYFAYGGYVLLAISMLFLFRFNKRFKEAFATSIIIVVCAALSLVCLNFENIDIIYYLYDGFDFSVFLLLVMFYYYSILGFSNIFNDKFSVDEKKKFKRFLIVIFIFKALSVVYDIVTMFYFVIKSYWVNFILRNFNYLNNFLTAVVVIILSITIIRIITKIRKGIIKEDEEK